jgi:hypothetical protein
MAGQQVFTQPSRGEFNCLHPVDACTSHTASRRKEYKMSTKAEQQRRRALHWPAVHHSSGTPEKPHPKNAPSKVQRGTVAQPAVGIATMAVYVADGITDAAITDAYFSTTYGSYGDGWYLVQDFQYGDWIIVGAPGYNWNSFQGEDGAEIGIGLYPQF